MRFYKLKHNWRKIVAGSFLTSLIIVSLVFVFFNVFDVEFPIVNPAPTVVYRYFTLTYPQNSPAYSLILSVNLTTRGDFVQGQPVNIQVGGLVTVNFLENVPFIYPNGFQSNYTELPDLGMTTTDTGIRVGFAGAPLLLGTPTQNYYSPSGTATEMVVNTTSPVYFNRAPGYSLCESNQTVTWTSQGDYSPEVYFNTGRLTLFMQSTDVVYSNIVVHINSADVLANARYNRINEVLSIVVVIFALVEACKLLYEATKK